MRFSENKKGFFEGKGFYLVLAFCLVAIGAAAWSAATLLSDNPKTPEAQNQGVSSISAQAEKNDVEKLPSEVKEPSSSEEESSSEASSQEMPQADDPTPVAKYFVLPISGEVLKGFSADKLQYSITYNDRRLHRAIDIMAEQGTPVKASGEGIVTDVYTDSLMGVVVKVDHGNGVEGYYCGLGNKVKVKKGDIVSGGKVIGTVGEIPAESLDPAHLHLEFTKDGEYVSPLALMGLEE